MAFIKNNMPDSPFKEIIIDKSVVLWKAASQAVSLHVMRSMSIYDKGHFVNKVKRGCLFAVFNRSYDRLKTDLQGRVP